MTIPTPAQLQQTFAPKIKLDEIEGIAQALFDVESDAFYRLMKELTARYKPSWQDQYEAKWEHLYLPVEREGELVCTAITLFLSYKKSYHMGLQDLYRYGGVGVTPGSDDIPEDYALILAEIERFQPLVDEYGLALIEQLYPYQWRSGRVQRKYIVDPSRLLSIEEGDNILSAYAQHEARNLMLHEISLNDYLSTSAICYRAAFPDEIENIKWRMDVTEATPELLHKSWADGRHGGMLFLEDRDSPTAYMEWYTSRSWQGAHPFEIVYSGNGHGIMLYPPDEREPRYQLSVVDPFYNDAFLKMTSALIEQDVPVIAYSLSDVVEYCKGQSYSDVNKMSMREFPFVYSDTPEEREKYFDHIEWEPILMLERSSGESQIKSQENQIVVE